MVSLQHSQERQCIGAGEQKWQEDGLGCQQLKHLTDVGNPHRQQEHEALPDEDSVLLENLEERPSARTKQIKGLSPSLTRPLIVLSKAASAGRMKSGAHVRRANAIFGDKNVRG